MEIKYIEDLEVQQANKTRILKAVRIQQQDFEHQLCCRQTTVQDPVVIPNDIDKSDKEAMIRMAGSGADDQELLVPSVGYINYKPTNLGNTKNVDSVNVTQSGVSTNKIGKHMDKSMEIEDKVKAPDVVATKRLNISVGSLEDVGSLRYAFKIAETDVVTAKSLNISVKGLGDTSKITETDAVAIQSLDVSIKDLRDIGNLGDAIKSVTTIIER